MEKFKLQKGIISGALAISMLFSGCSKNNENSQISSSSIDTNIEEVQNAQYAKYMITKYAANDVKNEDGTITYEMPEKLKDLESFVLEGDTCYMFLELVENTAKYITVRDLEKAKLIAKNYQSALNNEKETIETDNYRIETFNTSNFYNEKGERLYYLPKGYIEVEGKAYKVYNAYKVSPIIQEVVDAEVKIQPDGTKIYFAPAGYTLTGTKAVKTVPVEAHIQSDGTITYCTPSGYILEENKVISKEYVLVDNPDESLEIVNNYLSENNSVKKLTK